MKKRCFLDLPDALLQAVCNEWITLSDVARLDSALCSRDYRDRFLEFLNAKTVFSSASVYCDCDQVNELLFPYLKCYPATRIVLAKSDILYDEGLSFANSLQHLGVQSKSYAYSSVHGFFGRIPGIGLDALQDACAALLEIEKDS
jgi:acetyl esterase/lipase